MSIKIALPKGRLLDDTANLLEKAGWGLGAYNEKARLYRLKSTRFPDLMAKVFHEKDIPIQVAIGNYDLGVCGLDWVEELLTRYPNSALVKVKDLGYGEGILCLAGKDSQAALSLEEIKSRVDKVRIVSEYPNLAESFAVRLRLRRFGIFPLWGGAEVYPPETADLALVATSLDSELNYGLTPVSNVLDFSAFLIANANSWEAKDLSEVLTSLEDKLPVGKRSPARAVKVPETAGQYLRAISRDTVWLALPDGHQQQAIASLLSRAGIEVSDYPSATGNRRPGSNLPDVMIKVIRPQDMPLQVANGNFDLAITGRDWLKEHLYQFSSSPVAEVLDLGTGRVRIVAVVSNGLPIKDIADLRRFNAGRQSPVRVASEYANIADRFARDNHLGMYRIIPTWGASEAFLPEDADLLIENTETGQTLARHNLRVIDTLFESTACLIGRSDGVGNQAKAEKVAGIIGKFKKAVESA